jgi:hypothetical protein
LQIGTSRATNFITAGDIAGNFADFSRSRPSDTVLVLLTLQNASMEILATASPETVFNDI